MFVFLKRVKMELGEKTMVIITSDGIRVFVATQS